ncbi:MAG: carboxylesterase/lipase family protein [Sphingomonadaceae bacterium]|nr:carboxylesterase/lipase family protein [Sphingomonadaceae bacterium]
MTLISTGLGPLRGECEGGVTVFRGVPFAAPPVGDLRWRRPDPPRSWPGIRDATAFGPIAPQTISPRQLARSGGRMDEDCLYLNVWTPAADGAKRPILVFVHGGGMISGSGSAPLLNGSRLAERADLVVVTLNYRLGALGVINAPNRLDETSAKTSANLALQDIMAALAFLRREGAAYGGDPNNIVLTGQSSGGVAVACLMAHPDAASLFDKAILQSGGLERVIAAADAAEIADGFLAAFGSKSAAELRQLPLDAIMAAQATPVGQRILPPRGEFHPFVDGDVVPEHPILAALAGRTAPIPILTGTTAQEWKTFDDASLAADFDETRLRSLVEMLLPDGAEVDVALERYRTDLAALGEAPTPRAIASHLVGDLHFVAPTELFARGHAAAGNPVYHYELEWRSPTLGLGACHNICLPLLFGTLEVGAKLSGAGAEADAMSRRLQEAWGAFARTGDPSTVATGKWPCYDPECRPTLRIGERPRVVHGQHADRLAIWQAAYPWLRNREDAPIMMS